MNKTEAIKILDKYDLNFCDIDGNPIPPQDLAEAFDMAIEALEQEPKTGHWIGIDDYPHEDWECNNCGYVIEAFENPNDFRYCPNCGARMESDGE